MNLDLAVYGYPEIKINQVSEERKLKSKVIGTIQNEISSFVKTYRPTKDNSPAYIAAIGGSLTTLYGILTGKGISLISLGLAATGAYFIYRWRKRI